MGTFLSILHAQFTPSVIRELVRKKTGLDWPELQLGDIEKAMSSVTLFYWCTKEDVGKRWLQKQLELTDDEAESIIGV